MEYTNENRGKIQNRDRAKQIIDFSGLKFGSITPTDIDGVIEYHNKAIIFIEMKYGEQPLPRGQKVALMRMVDDLQNANKESCLLVCVHNVDNPEIDVDAAQTNVKYIYWNHKRIKVRGTKKLIDTIDNYIRYVDSIT